jgi:uncharacterized protein HemY
MFIVLFTTDRSLNAFLLFFFILLAVEVALSVVLKYVAETDDKYSK